MAQWYCDGLENRVLTDFPVRFWVWALIVLSEAKYDAHPELNVSVRFTSTDIKKG